MDGKKIYQIQINGINESINAVEALNKKLSELESRIKALENSSLKISTSSNSSSSGRSSKSALTEEEKLARQIEQIDAKRETYGKRIYQNYLAAKDVLKETVEDQKQLAAQERLQANNYTNTMKGMKDKLADIKNIMQTTDIGSDLFKKYTQEANALTQKLKELEEAYGQFGRNVGNYKSAADGFSKIKVAVGDTVREYDNYKQALKTLKNEQFQLSQTLGQESKEYKDVHNAIKQLESDYKDLGVSSKFMDNMLDSMSTITAAMNVGVGLSNFFGIDDAVFEDAMRKMVGLSQALQGLEVLKQQWQADDSWLLKPFKMLSNKIGNIFKPISEYFDKLPNMLTEKAGSAILTLQEKLHRLRFDKIGSDAALEDIIKKLDLSSSQADAFRVRWAGFTEEVKKSQYAMLMLHKQFDNSGTAIMRGLTKLKNGFKVLGAVAKSVFAGAFLLFLPEIIQYITDLVKSLDKTKIAADAAEKSLNALNRSFEKRMDMLGSSYMKGEITSEEYLKSLYDEQSDAIIKQIGLLQKRADAAKDNGILGTGWFKQSENADFSGKRMNGTTTVSSGMFDNLEVTVKNIGEVEKAWRRANAAIREGKDYIDMWGEDDTWYQRLKKEWDSIFATVSNTEEVMKGMGNIKLSDAIAQFQEVTKSFNEGRISADKYAKELAKIRDAMSNNDILNSVIANLDKYIPDEKVREQVQNIINKIYELDDAFNTTSAEQIHHWNQVRIDAMKDGLKKTLAQIEENQRYEIQQEGKTEEQINLIKAKYQRQRLDAQEKAGKEGLAKQKEINKKIQDADNQLIALRIANMKDGFDKRMAELDNQKRLELQKLAADAKDNKYIKVQEMTVEIEKKYDKLKLDEKRKWAFDTLKVYEDLAQRINQFNEATMQTEASTATERVETRQRKAEQSAGSTFITPTTYDDSKELEKYYARIVEIKKEAAERELQIERERLSKAVDYQREEEELRHKRLLDENGGEYIQQLRAGLITQEQYDKLIEDENNAHYARMNAINKQYESNLSATTQDTLEETQKLYSDYYGNIINNLRNDKSKVDELVSKSPITDTKGWDIVNIGKTSAAYNKALADYDNLRQEILKKQAKLRDDLEKGNISAEAFGIRQREIDAELKSLDEAAKGVKEKQKMLFADFVQSIQPYIQAVGQAVNQILSSLSEITQNQYQAQIDEQQKYIEKYEDMLDLQREITQKYADDVNNIEDELKTARGDRRQQLIDNLNAEMAAQRASLAQEKKIEREKQKADDKKKKLEHDQAVAKKKMDLAQAYINAAMAVSMAAVNKWPIPAIPMMALAAAAGAAQIAAVASQNIPSYGDGGVIQGKSHAQGGVKVLGGRAEVEGGEFITNKVTTSRNVELLEYVNSKKKRINLDDMIEFYGGNVRKSVSSASPKYKFAEGGVIPTLRTDIDINDRLVNVMEDYANRQVVVSVVDINDRQAAVREVEVLSGLNNE